MTRTLQMRRGSKVTSKRHREDDDAGLEADERENDDEQAAELTKKEEVDEEPCMEREQKRPASAALASQRPLRNQDNNITFSLCVKWSALASDTEDNDLRGQESEDKTKIKSTRLVLNEMQDISKLGGLSRGLLDRAFPLDDEDTPRPPYLISPEYLRYTPEETCLSFPTEVAHTEFKLIASWRGWEYCVYASPRLNRDGDIVPSTSSGQDERPLFVTTIEFDSVAVVLGNLGIRVSLVSYPIVAISRDWLENVKKRIIEPGFKGILTCSN